MYQRVGPTREFRDGRLRYIVNSIIPFSRGSVSKATRDLLLKRSPFGSEEEVYGLMFLEMLNAVTELFSSIDSYFMRGPSDMGAELVGELLTRLMHDLGDEVRLAGAGLTSSLSSVRTEEELERQHARLHSEDLASRDYERLQAVQDILTYSLMKPYLPVYVQEDLKTMPEVVDRALKARLGPLFGREELGSLAKAITQVSKTHGNVLIATEGELQKYRPMVLTPRRFFGSTLEQLYEFPPFLIQRDTNEFACIVTEQPFIWVRKMELAFIDTLKRGHPNVSGDSVERILAEFLTKQQLLTDDEPPLGLQAVVKAHPHHFETAGSVRLSRNTREDIFAVLGDPDQPELQVDLVANHRDGFSAFGESKFVTSYPNAERYYYQGSDDKEAEQRRLLNLTKFLNSHPRRKAEFGIPVSNPVVPVFITNAVGPLFADKDGVTKATPFEVMMVEPFYALVRDAAQES